MKKTARRGSVPIAVLTLSVDVPGDRPDWPLVSVLVDGVDPFAEVAPGWRGFDPDQLLGAESPLLPVEPIGRRVALRCCSCDEPGCGVIAPVVIGSPDRRRVSWVDPRDYTGVFGAPLAAEPDPGEGTLWAVDDIHFDRAQYVEEVARATADRSWETARRTTARLVRERLLPRGLVLPPDLALGWVATSPGRGTELAVELSFSRFDPASRPRFRQQLLLLASEYADPDRAAADIVDRLQATAPHAWTAAFGGRRH